MHIVSFFVEPERGSAAARINDLVPGKVQARMMRDSFVKQSGPAGMTLLTDSARFDFDVSYLDADGPIRSELMMLDCVDLQARFFRGYNFPSPAIVCDPDMLFFNDIRPVFDQDFDIALTTRANARMPYNSGIILANSKRPEMVRRFFDLQHEIMSERLRSMADWYGDQIVLKIIVDEKGLRIGSDMVDVDGIRIALLDGNRYNFSPRRDHPYLFLPPRCDVYHFKGRCRPYMPHFFRHYVQKKGPAIARLPSLLWNGARLELQRKSMKSRFESDRKRVVLKEEEGPGLTTLH